MTFEEAQQELERTVERLEGQHPVQAEHPHVVAQVAPANDVPPPAMVHDAIRINRPLGSIVGTLIA